MRHPFTPLGLVPSLALSLGLLWAAPVAGLAAADGAPAAAAAAAAVPIPLEGWKGEAEQYSNPVTLKCGDDAGTATLTLSVKGGEKDKAAVCRALAGVKLPAGGVLRARIANLGTQTVPLTIALKTGNSWTFHESERTGIKPGTQDVAIDLTAATFKSEATGWKNTGTITDLEAAKELQIALYNGNLAVEVVVSALTIAPKP